MTCTTSVRTCGRHGFTIPEIIVSMILLGAVLGVIVPLAKRANDQARLSSTRRAALLEVSNALERLTADPAAWPAPGEEWTVPLPDSLNRQLPEAKLVISNMAVEDPPGRRFDASLTWVEPTKGRSAPIRLSAFAFEPPTAAGGAP